MHIFRGTVTEALSKLSDVRFIPECVSRFTAHHGHPPGQAELNSWRNSWPALLRLLSAAELGTLELLLEYELAGSSERVDALLLGRRPGADRLVTVVFELKQWTEADPHPASRGLLRAGGRDVQHPSRQVGSYVHYLRDWMPAELALEVRGLALLHNAPGPLIDKMKQLVSGGPSVEYPLLGHDDLRLDEAPGILAARLTCENLIPATVEQTDGFLRARHRPSVSLLSRVADTIAGHNGFRLIGEQDRARQEILGAVDTPLHLARGHVIVVAGGPGTGKTAIATRLLGDLCRVADANPRLYSPSGTLTKQLLHSVGDQGKGLIKTLTTTPPGDLDRDTSVVLLDEAHRARTDPDHRRSRFPHLLTRLVNSCRVLVCFLDERQIIRPNEGTTVDELRELAASVGYEFTPIDLPTQFRCSGSRRYLNWIDTLFSDGPEPPAWDGVDYDLALAENPAELEAWVNDHEAHDRSARMTAGFCWPWESGSRLPLLPEVSVTWADAEGSHVWQKPWNAGSEALEVGLGTPGRPYWATGDGGHQQVGCVYTAQGMEYGYSAVILGDDLRWTGHRWEAHPRASHDTQVNYLSPERYRRFALNIYRVLATRGTRGTRLCSTDPGTQEYLRTLLPPRPA